MTNDNLRAGAAECAAKLQKAGFTAYWAGGCVRDLLLGREPVDYDIATDAPPERVIELFSKSFYAGKSFGVVRAPCRDNYYEIATFRRESGYSDGRHPDSVEFTTAEKDALRRDFTVNAIFYDPATDETIDYVCGREDIQARLIRCVGDPFERFSEDYLRIIRAVRFASVLDFKIEEKTMRAVRETAHRISTISVERTTSELRKTLRDSYNPSSAALLLSQSGILSLLFDKLIPKEHTPNLFPNLKPEFRNNLPLIIAAMLIESEASGDRKLIRGTLERMRFSRREITQIQEYIDNGLQEPQKIERWISGREILALGVPEGEKVGQILDKALEMQLSGSFSGKDELLETIKAISTHTLLDICRVITIMSPCFLIRNLNKQKNIDLWRL